MMNEVKPALEKVTTSRWRWWIYLLMAAVVLFAGAAAVEWVNDKMYGVGASALSPPVAEIAATNNATAAIKKRVEEAQKVRAKLPEVVKNAKDMARIDVNGLNDNNIADRWNGLLGRYREDRAAAEGVSAPE